MADAFEELLGGDVLSEDVKTSLTEAWEVKLSEAREQITNEIREEFAGRYTNDKEQIVEAMDKMLTDKLVSEMEEFKVDKQALATERVNYKTNVSKHLSLVDKFVAEHLAKEVKELHADRNGLKNNFAKLENFVVKQLAKGLTEFLVISRHALRNAMLSVVTILGVFIGYLLGGSIITESVFNYPGVGTLLLQAIQQRDYGVIQGIILFISLIFMFINLMVDISYAILDPRIRYE